jgi:hypothetical protein
MFRPSASADTCPVVAEGLSPLLDEIETLLSEPPAGGDEAVARVEQTLTDGYARALALEAERWRIERRLAEVVRLAARGSAQDSADELAELSGRLEHADADLRLLRDRLGSLRRVAAAVRSA